MRKLFLLLLILSAGRTATAQIAEVYGTVAIYHLSNVKTGYSESNTQTTTYNAAGGTIGGTINFIPLHVIAVGLDVRDTFANNTNMWLAGIQIAVKPPVIKLKPYFKLSVGEAHLHVAQNYDPNAPSIVPDNFYIYNAALGVDYRWNSFIDFRVLEIGDGRTLGAGSTNPTQILTINAGIVFHTP